MAAAFVLVPLSLKFLSKEEYGIWLTLNAFISWFSFFDFGLGYGLRNKFAEAKAKDKVDDLRGYVSTAYLSVIVVSVILFVCFIFIGYSISWSDVFGLKAVYEKELKILMPLIFGFYCLQLIFRLISSVYMADQKASVSSALLFYTQLGLVLGLFLLGYYGGVSLLKFGIVFSAVPVLILIILNLKAFINDYPDLVPRLSCWKFKFLKDIFGLGIKFFVLQISVLILFSTDNYIISRYIGPDEVVSYNLSHKFFGIANTLQLIVLAPFWSAFTDAYTRKDMNWVKGTMSRLNQLTVLLLVGILIMFFMAPFAYELWVGKEIQISRSLDFWMMLHFAVLIYFAPYNHFINGTGKINLHTIGYAISAVVNIPLSVFLARNLGFGVQGVIMATVICLAPYVFLFRWQFISLTNT